MTPSRPAARAGGRQPVGAVRGYAALFGVAVVVVLAVGFVTRSPLPASAAEEGGAVREDAAALFLQNCASCHGQGGEGTESGPSLIGVGEASADFYLRTGRMPLGAPDQRPERQDPHFVNEDIEALVAFVASLGPGPTNPQVSAGGDLGRGWSLYTANCAACHGATGAGNAVGGGFAAANLTDASSLEIAQAMLVGPGVMPRFGWSPEDQDALVAYVVFLQDMPTPGGAPIGGFGPVGEGFVAVLVGLTLMVVAARFVGRRTRPDELPVEAAAPPAEPEAGR
jgi:ubiquinol-cytochrome c reductase cytochrome c subunit